MHIWQKIKLLAGKVAGIKHYHVTVKDNVNNEQKKYEFYTLPDCQRFISELERASFYKMGDFSVVITTMGYKKQADLSSGGEHFGGNA